MFEVLRYWYDLARLASDRRRAIESLSRLSDAQLQDIGLERQRLEEHVDEGWPAPPRMLLSIRPLRPQRSVEVPVQGCG